MRRSKWLAVVGLLGALMLTAAACSSNKSGTSGATGGGGTADKCKADQFGCVTYKAGEPIRIGSLLAISGDVATLGNDSNHGIQLGIDYLDGNFNATNGKLLGHDVTLQQEDDLCSKDGGQAGGTKLAADPTILAVIGTSCSSSALGVADKILGDKGVLLISPSNTAAGLTAPATHNPFYLRTAQNDAIQAKVVADFVYNKLAIKSAATMNDGGPYTSGLTTGFESFYKQLGGSITASETFDPTLKDFKPLLTSIAQGHPGLIYFPDFDPPCALITIQALQVPALSTVKLLGSDGCNESNYYKLAKSAALNPNVFLSSPKASPGATTALYTQEQEAYTSQYGKPTASFNANGFDAFNLLVKAIKQVAIQQSDGTIQIPRTALKNALYQIKNYPGITGPLTCISTGDCQSQLAVNIAIYQGKTGPFAPGESPSKADVYFNETLNLQSALSGSG